jgi:hypothetical protein
MTHDASLTNPSSCMRSVLFCRLVMADGICPSPIKRCRGTRQTNQATTSDSQAGQLRSSDPYKELGNLADNFWNSLCHTHSGGLKDCSRCHLPGRLHGTQMDPCCLLLLSSEIREDVAKIDLQCFSNPIMLEWNCSTYSTTVISVKHCI